MDLTAGSTTKSTATKAKPSRLATVVNRELDASAAVLAPFAARWDAEADRRKQLRTPENLKALVNAQREYNSARVTERQAAAQLRLARKDSKNPLSGVRRAARTSVKGARTHRKAAHAEVKAAKRNYPDTLAKFAAKAHAVHTVPAGLTSYALSTSADWTVWPAATSVALIAANLAALAVGRRKATVDVDDGASAEEKQLLERLHPTYWVEHADARGLGGTVTAPASITSAGIEAHIRLDGQWTVKKLRAATDSIRALLGARTELPMLVAAGPRGGWAVVRLRTRSAAPDGVIVWKRGDALGVDMVTGDDVDIPLGKRMLIAGTSGAGKSTAARPLLFKASEGPENVLVIIDLKKVEGRLWDHRARVASDPEAVVALVLDLVDELNERLDVLPKGQATLVPTATRPRITVVVDEGAEVMSTCDKVEIEVDVTESGKPITEKVSALDGLDSIARMGRAACIDLWWMTQSPTYGDGVPRQIAKQLGTRLGLAVESPSEARVVFGESAQEKGLKADELPMPGVAMLRDGKRSPDPIKARYMDDDAVVALPNQPIWHRGGAQGEEVPAPARPALRLIKDAPAPASSAQLTDTEAAVLDAVRAGAIRQKDVVDAAGLAKGTVSKTVSKLITAGELTKAEDGTLAVTAEEVPA